MEEERKPVCTIGLAVINVVVFLWMSFGGMTEDSVYMLQHGAAYTPYIVDAGEYYRMFTSIFLHFDFSHLMNNMLVLLVLGWNLEPVVGKMRVLVIYLLSGLGGNLLSLLMDLLIGEFAVSAGASGAVFGFTGALLCLAIRNHGRIGNLTKQGMLVVTVLSLYLGFTGEGVDNAAHIGGLLMGFIVTFLIYRKRNFEHRSLTDDRSDLNGSVM